MTTDLILDDLLVSSEYVTYQSEVDSINKMNIESSSDCINVSILDRSDDLYMEFNCNKTDVFFYPNTYKPLRIEIEADDDNFEDIILRIAYKIMSRREMDGSKEIAELLGDFPIIDL